MASTIRFRCLLAVLFFPSSDAQGQIRQRIFPPAMSWIVPLSSNVTPTPSESMNQLSISSGAASSRRRQGKIPLSFHRRIDNIGTRPQIKGTRRLLQEPGNPRPDSSGKCRSLTALSPTPLTWHPHHDKYLLMLCFRNQISNLMRCMRNHVLLAGLLNRTLLVPDWIPFSDRNLIWPEAWQHTDNPNHKIFDLRVLWDFEHANRCLGRGRVMRLEDFEMKEEKKVVIDVIHCWYGHQVDFKAMLSHTTASASCLPHIANVSTVIDEFSSKHSHVRDARVLVAGELVNMKFADPEQKLFQKDVWGQDPFTRTAQCPNRLLMQPAQELFDHSREVAHTLFGGHPFLALHWRRGDFMWYCQWTPVVGRCTFSAPQAAVCVMAKLLALNISRVYLATNAAAREVIAFKRYLARVGGMDVRVYSAPPLKESDPWLRALEERGVDVKGQKGLLTVTLDKVLCASADVFVGSVESTFTLDIQRMRVGLGRDSSCDSNLCHNEVEWDSTKIFDETKKTLLSHQEDEEDTL